jgi:ATP-binding cassette subfamily F protein 3
MLALKDIACSIGERVLFSGVSFNLNPYDRFGLVGANGSGKTTLLRIILGEQSSTAGSLEKPYGLKIGYLPQEEIVLKGNTLMTEVLRDFHAYIELLNSLRKRLSTNSSSKEINKQYEQAELRFEQIGGYNYEIEAHKVIHGLGFDNDDRDKLVEEFSSGWQMRIVLARLLLNKPDILLLDEPTNHLDIESIQWLEEYLQKFKGALMIVSHDRYFLDRILQTNQGTRGIFEIDFGQFRRYRTNYTGYLHESQSRRQRLLHMAKTQEKKVKEIKEFIARNRANKSKAKLVKSREKYLERMVRVQQESDRKKIRVNFPIAGVHSQRLVELKKVGHKYDENVVFDEIDCVIQRGDRIALIGKNGVGKSTLCRIIAGFEKPAYGKRIASERLEVAAFSHAIVQELDKHSTVLDEASKDAHPDIMRSIRSFLGLFLFSGDDVNKPIDVLSGGEKTRLVVLKAMLEPSNMLILDEPTYHLDRDSVEAIKDAMRSYGGTTILVSHDRDLISDFANRIIEIKNGKLYEYPGDYQYYLWKKGKVSTTTGRVQTKKKESALEKMRHQLQLKEARQQRLRESFSRPGAMDNPRKARKLFEEYQRLTREIEELEDRLIQAS